jgi:hypothetical protein
MEWKPTDTLIVRGPFTHEYSINVNPYGATAHSFAGINVKHALFQNYA